MGVTISQHEKYVIQVMDEKVILNESFVLGKSQLNHLKSSNSKSSIKSAEINDDHYNGSFVRGKSINTKSFNQNGNISRQSSVVLSPSFPWILKRANFISPSINDFEIGRVIGTGLMGTVRIAKHKLRNAYVAIKCIPKDYIKRHNDERHLENEEAILSSMTSTFCVKLFAKIQDERKIYFVMEYIPGGELFSRLSKKSYFQPQTAKFYATEVFSALDHIHALGYVYRDLKPENILLDEQGHCKLVDFGFAIQPDAGTGLMHTQCGTSAYLSPEQLNGKFTNGYTSVVDFWAFGCLVYELLTGKTPFCKSFSETPYEIYMRVLYGKISFPRRMDACSKALIAQLCCADEGRRLADVESIKSNAYFTMDWTAVSKRLLVPPYVPRLTTEGDTHYFEEYKDF